MEHQQLVHPSYWSSQAEHIADQWHRSMRDIKNISNPDARKAEVEYLQDLHKEAQTLLEGSSQYLNHIVLGRLQHITDRPFTELLALYSKSQPKNGDNLITSGNL